MSKDWVADWLDNPIFIKHLRSRLRTQPLASAIVIVLVLCLCITWGGYELDGFLSGGAFGTFLALQTVILAIMGASQIGSAVGSARASGILDFHRVSPLTPTELSLGFFFGAPIREYFLFACTLPFSFLCVALGTPDFRGLLQLMILLVVSSWVLHAFSLLNALVLKKQAGARGVVGVVIFIGMLTGSFFPGFGRIAGVIDRDPRLSFYGISLPWLAVVLLYQVPVLFFLSLASRRKMDSERLHPFSKPQAIMAMAVLGLLVLGGIWELTDVEYLAVVVLYVLAIVAILLTTAVTPSQAESYKGLWRAHKQGKASLALWDDLSLNRPFLAVVCAILLITATIAWNRLRGEYLGRNLVFREAFPLAIADGVVVVAYFGLALQFFQLRFGRRGTNYFSLFLFLVWVVPLIAGSIYVFADFRTQGGPSQVIYAISPVAGIGLATGMGAGGGQGSDFMAVAGAAITPSLLFAFVFNGLVSAARKRVQRAVRIAIEKSAAAGEVVTPDILTDTRI
jgi:hypothetical protein